MLCQKVNLASKCSPGKTRRRCQYWGRWGTCGIVYEDPHKCIPKVNCNATIKFAWPENDIIILYAKRDYVSVMRQIIMDYNSVVQFSDRFSSLVYWVFIFLHCKITTLSLERTKNKCRLEGCHSNCTCSVQFESLVFLFFIFFWQ